jgi:predicted esterase
MRQLSRKLSRPAYEDLGEDQHLAPLFPPGVTPTLELWEREREKLRKRWDALLGAPSFGDFDRTARVVDRFEQPDYEGTVFKQPTGPETRATLLLMEPRRVRLSPRPGAVIPFYHPDPMAGYDLKTHHPKHERPVTEFGRHLVQQGYVVVCTEAFPFNTVPEPKDNKGFAWWQAGAEKLLRDNPHWTGIAKLAWDTSRALDLLLSRPDMDKERILVMGHSLGGKMAFYTGVLDERVKAIIGSDFGIGWKFTNWDAPWYLGDRIKRPGFTLAHHQLLALHAPRSFLLIGGQADRPASWQYIQEAQKVYKLCGKEDAVGFFDHASGHAPTDGSLRLAYRWLAEQSDLPEQPWLL